LIEGGASSYTLDRLKRSTPEQFKRVVAGELPQLRYIIPLDSQYEWETIYAGKMSEEDIMAARRKMQKLRLQAERKHFPDGFQAPQTLVTLAAEETQAYMALTYEVNNRDQE
jgi:hypothetical protein